MTNMPLKGKKWENTPHVSKMTNIPLYITLAKARENTDVARSKPYTRINYKQWKGN